MQRRKPITNSTPTGQKAEEPTDSEQAPAFDAAAETVTDDWEGTFIYTSWGYDQTNINVAQIIDVSASGKTILARLVVAETVEQRNASEHLRPTPKPYSDEFRLHVRRSRNQPAFRGSYPYINGDMDEGTRLDSFLPFENTPDNTVRQTAHHHRH